MKLGRIQTLALAGISALALTVPAALAQTAGGDQQGQTTRAERRAGKGERGGKRHGRRGGKRGGRDFGVRGLRGVELSDAQKASLKQLREGFRERTGPVREQLRAKRQELRQAQSGAAFNESLAAQKLAETAGLKARMMAERHRLQQESLAVLTPEQRTQLEQRRQQSEQRRAQRKAERAARSDRHGSREATLAQELEQAHDAELARLAREGDESAFAEIVRRHSPRVFRTAGRFFRRREQVEEAAQEVFLKAFTQLDSYEARGSFEGWLTRITTNTCLNILRSARRRPELSASELSEDESAWLESRMAGAAAERQQTAERGMVAADLADKVLGTMSEDDRLVLLMMDGEEASVKEVAQATGWTESNVKVKAMRARRRMREAVEKLMSLGGKRV